MKGIKIIYYVSTGLMSLAMAGASYAYYASPEMKQIIVGHFGFPDYFRIEIALAKFLAAIALWLPVRLIKMTAYIGLAIMFVSGFIAHLASNDPFNNTVAPLIALTTLIVSYVSYTAIKTVKN